MTPMRVVLAYDASAGAEAAASLVESIPWPSGSMVRVVAVAEPSAMSASALSLSPAPMVIDIDAVTIDHLQGELDRSMGRLRVGTAEIVGEVLRGRPASVLAEEARKLSADLVICGSRGHGAIASLVLGSVSAELVDQAPCPVLVVRHTAIERVLFASDGSSSARYAEGILARWPIFDAAIIRVVSVAEVVRPLHSGIAPTMYREVIEASARDLEVARKEHETIARDAADRLETAGRRVDAKLLVGDPPAEIIDEADSWPADLVVLGSRGMTGLSRIVLGSVARNVLQGGRTSVLIVRETGEGSGDAA
jgi:nucleotide-binding universal stress UspA family protein